MTIFTDPLAAVDEATYLASQTDRSHAIVRDGDAMTVVSYGDAWRHKREILEVCNPTWEGVA